MCGIVGTFDPRAGKIDQSVLRAMTDTLRHRGPDGSGIYIDGPLGFGHRRLSIIDLESGKQPMSNEDETIWITYNGEIYNFQDIRSDLKTKGHQFKTNSDTEVIIHAYEEYGNKCVDLFRGMFAFALWDSNKKQLFLARDRIGKKPLYYYFDGKKFLFASEIKAILQDKRVQKELDYSSLVDYFTYHYVPFPKSIFKRIYKLPPAHYLVVRLMTTGDVFPSRISSAPEQLDLSVHQYWDLEFRPDFSLSEADWLEGLKEKLRESVRLRLISDVPLGAFLSGGMDSSSVVAMMNLASDRQIKTFSIEFEHDKYNEIEFARMVSKKFSTDHHEFTVLPDAVEALEKLTWAFDEPFADSSAIPTYYVSKMARQHVTVILSGDGGDEAFAGYDRYRVASDWQRFDCVPGALRHLMFGGLSSLLPMGIKGKGRLRNLSRTSFLRSAGLRTFDFPGYLRGLLSEDLFSEDAGNYDENDNSYLFLRQFYEKYPEIDCVSKLQYEDMKTYLAEDIMAKVDRASMFCSLETRAPLLDHKLLEFVARIPPSLLINKGEKKYLLKKAMEEFLPPKVMYRKKQGFEIPLNTWLKTSLTEFSQSTLLSKRSEQRGFFNIDNVRKILDCHQKKSRDLSPQIWALLFFEYWCRNWLD